MQNCWGVWEELAKGLGCGGFLPQRSDLNCWRSWLGLIELGYDGSPATEIKSWVL